MRAARIQVALEAVLLKTFGSPSETLERRIIQSSEFRSVVLPIWVKHCMASSKVFTQTNISDLANVSVCEKLFSLIEAIRSYLRRFQWTPNG
jgi:hypothetical protein